MKIRKLLTEIYEIYIDVKSNHFSLKINKKKELMDAFFNKKHKENYLQNEFLRTFRTYFDTFLTFLTHVKKTVKSAVNIIFFLKKKPPKFGRVSHDGVKHVHGSPFSIAIAMILRCKIV